MPDIGTTLHVVTEADEIQAGSGAMVRLAAGAPGDEAGAGGHGALSGAGGR